MNSGGLTIRVISRQLHLISPHLTVLIYRINNNSYLVLLEELKMIKLKHLAQCLIKSIF